MKLFPSDYYSPFRLESRLNGNYKNKNGCWEWQGPYDSFGRAVMGIEQKTYRAYRISFLIWKGPIPKGKNVCHSCDNPSCINPDHLWLGTQKQNIYDALHKKRKFGVFKLNYEKAKTIRRKYGTGKYYLTDLAKQFGVSRPAIANIVRRKVWSKDF